MNTAESSATANVLALAAISLWALLAWLGISLAHVPPFLLTGVALLVGSVIALPLMVQKGRLDLRAPAAFLKMIVVHELAHLKEREHNKAFYQLCRHMEPDYAQLEFDLRLYLTALEMREA